MKQENIIMQIVWLLFEKNSAPIEIEIIDNISNSDLYELSRALQDIQESLYREDMPEREIILVKHHTKEKLTINSVMTGDYC